MEDSSAYMISEYLDKEVIITEWLLSFQIIVEIN